jgi:metal-responsive CopG/Arc/MetJ family transcriptional regulator
MKTAVSVPDELFRQAEAAARRLQMSRSELYSTALARYLEKAEDDETTRRLNEVYAKEPSNLDPAIRRAQFKTLSKDSW